MVESSTHDGYWAVRRFEKLLMGTTRNSRSLIRLDTGAGVCICGLELRCIFLDGSCERGLAVRVFSCIQRPLGFVRSLRRSAISQAWTLGLDRPAFRAALAAYLLGIRTCVPGATAFERFAAAKGDYFLPRLPRAGSMSANAVFRQQNVICDTIQD